MSGEPTTQRRESEHSYSIQYAPEAAAVPHWLIFKNDLSYPARMLAIAILAHQQGGSAPTREALASDLGVNTRTIDRQLDELRAAKLLSTHRTTRQHQFGVLEPRRTFESTHGSTLIPVSNIDNMINVDNTINVDPCVDSGLRRSIAVNRTRVDPCVDSGSHGGGGDPCFRDSDSPPTTAPRRKISPAEITAPAGRWMVAEGFSLAKAHQHQNLPLAPAQADYQRRRQLGQGHGAIALAWEVAPPTGDSQAAPLEPIAGEFTFSAHEKERYRAMGFAIGDEQLESEGAK